MEIDPKIYYSKYNKLYLEDVLFFMRFSKISYKKLYEIFQNNRPGKIIIDAKYIQRIYFDINKLKNYTGEVLPDILIKSMYNENKHNTFIIQKLIDLQMFNSKDFDKITSLCYKPTDKVE